MKKDKFIIFDKKFLLFKLILVFINNVLYSKLK